MILERVDGVCIGRRLNQHYCSRLDEQAREHIYGVRRAGNHHQVARLNRKTLFSIDFFHEKIDKAWRSLLWTILERCIALRRAYDALHGIAKFGCKKRSRIWMAKQK